MSVSPIITEGLGSFGSPSYIITLGYLAGAPAPVTTDTHDGFRKKKPYVDDEELIRQGKELRAKEQERLAEKKLLRDQINIAIYGEPEISEGVAAKALAFTPYDNAGIERLEAQLRQAEKALQAIHEEMRQNAIRARQAKDEHEIQIILQALRPTIH